jgi:preprotein translocase subunit SecA
MLETFRGSEEMPVEAPHVREALDKVQKAVKDQYREICSEIFRFADETLDEQRKAIYSRRGELLFADPENIIAAMKQYYYNTDTAADIVVSQEQETDWDGTPVVVVDTTCTKDVAEKLDRFFPGASVGDLSEGVNKAYRPAVILARYA